MCCSKITNAHTGKMLGGSASHNSMIHSRGSPKDFDNWANILNDESFNYSNVLKYFKRMETFVGHKFGSEGDGKCSLSTYTSALYDCQACNLKNVMHRILRK